MGVSMIQIGDGIVLVLSWVLRPKFHLKLIVNIALKMGIIYLATNLGRGGGGGRYGKMVVRKNCHQMFTKKIKSKDTL
jgi:hypothetical protein